MITPPGQDPHELADMPQLSDLQATDALLDRLGSRSATDDDLRDPVITELARLAEFADAPFAAAPELDRLIELLGGRPLYLLERGSGVLSEADQPIQLDSGTNSRRVIDLSDSAASLSSGTDVLEADATADLPDVAARASQEPAGVTSLDLIRALRAGRRPVGTRAAGLHGLMQQVALPAASIIAVALLSGGVTAVVAGDPMAPINGVQEIASQLPGFGGDDGSQGEVKAVESDINNARAAWKNNEEMTARKFLASAQVKLAAVPDAQKKQDLTVAIANVQISLQPTVPVIPSATVAATPVASASATPAPSVVPSSTPAPSVTEPAPSATVPAPSLSATPPADPAPSQAATPAP